MSIEYLITALIVILVPGTGVVYTVVTGLSAGRRASIAAALGCTLGIVPAILASILGLAAILHTSAVLFQVLKYAGAAYLLYLAWRTLKDSGPMRLDGDRRTDRGLLSTVRTGFLINILNPKLSVFFLAFLPQFVDPAAASPIGRMLGLGAVFMAMTFAVFVVYGGFAAMVGAKLLKSERVLRWMRRAVALTFTGFGLRLALAER
ncbi:LysE family translocator [Nitratireductor sp. CAU 1489]|uniref:LysE family translocator n=1 Tax=Nitratireductor arenosus TaxID=2682096 RepID=A0A844Q8R6_9HYPH|nr:LysE family translocator [Nitratireductor arenosus]MVA96486.1 LysE family translocator [Nitratireductor arenosus]